MKDHQHRSLLHRTCSVHQTPNVALLLHPCFFWIKFFFKQILFFYQTLLLQPRLLRLPHWLQAVVFSNFKHRTSFYHTLLWITFCSGLIQPTVVVTPSLQLKGHGTPRTSGAALLRELLCTRGWTPIVMLLPACFNATFKRAIFAFAHSSTVFW